MQDQTSNSYHMPLSQHYTFYVNKAKKTKENQLEYMRELGTPKTIDGFWMQFNNIILPSYLPHNYEYQFFKPDKITNFKHIEESTGGHWVIFVDKNHRNYLDQLWRNILVMIICNRTVKNDVNNPSQQILGASVSLKKSYQKIEVQIDNMDEWIIKSIGFSLKYQCGIPNECSITYQKNGDYNTAVSLYQI